MKIEIDCRIHLHDESSGRVAERLEQIFHALHQQGQHIMATLQEVKDELTAIKTAVDAGKVTAQQQIDLIAQLTAQIAAGSPVTQADLDALDAQADEILAALAPST
jgi:primosomal protein N''